MARRCSGTMYTLLGVPETATKSEIDKGYRRMAFLHHPDKAGEESAEQFKQIKHAHHILSDPQRRALYDSYGSDGENVHGLSLFSLFENPAILRLMSAVFFVIGVLLMTFAVLVAKKIEGKLPDMPWKNVFGPVWALDVMYGQRLLSTAFQQHRYTLPLWLAGVMGIALTGTICTGLERSTDDWCQHLVPLYVAVGVYGLGGFDRHYFPHFKQIYTEFGGEATKRKYADLTWRSRLYLQSLSMLLLSCVCMCLFCAMLSVTLHDVSARGLSVAQASYSPYAICSPVVVLLLASCASGMVGLGSQNKFLVGFLAVLYTPAIAFTVLLPLYIDRGTPSPTLVAIPVFFLIACLLVVSLLLLVRSCCVHGRATDGNASRPRRDGHASSEGAARDAPLQVPMMAPESSEGTPGAAEEMQPLHAALDDVAE